MISIKVNGGVQKDVIIERYPNGETRLDLTAFIPKGETTYTIVWKYETDADFLTLAFINDYLKSYANEENKVFIDLTILYMPYSRMDRSENDSVFTLKTACKLINDMEFNIVNVYEPHSDVTLKLLNNSRNIEISKILLDLVENSSTILDDNVPLYYFYPDKGAMARYSIDNGKPVLCGKKVRDFDTGRILEYDIVDKEDFNKLNKGEPFNVIIIDDLSSYGGTFVQASKRLKEVGAAKVILVVAHAEESIYKGELFDHIDKLYTTNSILRESLNDKTVVIKLI